MAPGAALPRVIRKKVCAILVLELVCFNALSCMCFCWSVLLQHLWWNMIGHDVFAVCVGRTAGGLAGGAGQFRWAGADRSSATCATLKQKQVVDGGQAAMSGVGETSWRRSS